MAAGKQPVDGLCWRSALPLRSKPLEEVSDPTGLRWTRSHSQDPLVIARKPRPSAH
jgi:hypothetical protein